jgi:hypothetical protein
MSLKEKYGLFLIVLADLDNLLIVIPYLLMIKTETKLSMICDHCAGGMKTISRNATSSGLEQFSLSNF